MSKKHSSLLYTLKLLTFTFLSGKKYTDQLSNIYVLFQIFSIVVSCLLNTSEYLLSYSVRLRICLKGICILCIFLYVSRETIKLG